MSCYLQILHAFIQAGEIQKILGFLKQEDVIAEFDNAELVSNLQDGLISIINGNDENSKEFLKNFSDLIQAMISEKMEQKMIELSSKISKYESNGYFECITSLESPLAEILKDSNYFVFAPVQTKSKKISLNIDRRGERMKIDIQVFSNSEYKNMIGSMGKDVTFPSSNYKNSGGVLNSVDYIFFCEIRGYRKPFPSFDILNDDQVVNFILNNIGMSYINKKIDNTCIFNITGNIFGDENVYLIKIDLLSYFEQIMNDYNNFFSSTDSSFQIIDYLGYAYKQSDGAILVPEIFKYLCESKIDPFKSLELKLTKQFYSEFKSIVQKSNLNGFQLKDKTSSIVIKSIADIIETRDSKRDSRRNQEISLETPKIEIFINNSVPEDFLRIVCVYIESIFRIVLPNNILKTPSISPFTIANEKKYTISLEFDETINVDQNLINESLLQSYLNELCDKEIIVVSNSTSENISYSFVMEHLDETYNLQGLEKYMKDIKNFCSTLRMSFKQFCFYCQDSLILQKFNSLRDCKNFLLRGLFQEKVTIESGDFGMLLPLNFGVIEKGKNKKYYCHTNKLPFSTEESKILKYSSSVFYFDSITSYKIIELRETAEKSNIQCYLVVKTPDVELTLKDSSPRPLQINKIDNSTLFLMKRSDGEPLFVDESIIPIRTDNLQELDKTEKLGSYIYELKEKTGNNIYVSEGNIERFCIEIFGSSGIVYTMSEIFKNIIESVEFKKTKYTIQEFVEEVVRNLHLFESFLGDQLEPFRIYMENINYNILNIDSKNLILIEESLPENLKSISDAFQLFIKSISNPIKSNRIISFDSDIRDRLSIRSSKILRDVSSTFINKVPLLPFDTSKRKILLNSEKLTSFEKQILSELFEVINNESYISEETLKYSSSFIELVSQFQELQNLECRITKELIKSFSFKDVRVLSCLVTVIQEVLKEKFSRLDIVKFLETIGLERNIYKIIDSESVLLVFENPIETYLSEKYRAFLTDGIESETGFTYFISSNYGNSSVIKRNILGNSLIHTYFNVEISNVRNDSNHDDLIKQICNKCLFYKNVVSSKHIEPSNISIELVNKTNESSRYTIYIPTFNSGFHLMMKRKYLFDEGVEFSCLSDSVRISICSDDIAEAYNKLFNFKILDYVDKKIWCSIFCKDIILNSSKNYIHLLFNVCNLQKDFIFSKRGTLNENNNELYVSFVDFNSSYIEICNNFSDIEEKMEEFYDSMHNTTIHDNVLEEIKECKKTPEIFRSYFRNISPIFKDADILCELNLETEKLSTETFGIINPFETHIGVDGLTIEKTNLVNELETKLKDDSTGSPFEIYSKKSISDSIRRTLDKHHFLMSTVNIELSLSMGLITDRSSDNLYLMKRSSERSRDSIMWKIFSETKDYLAIGMINSAVIYNNIAGKYYRLAVLYHENITDIIFSKMYCITISKNRLENSINVWFLPSGTKVKLYIPPYIYSVGDIVNCETIKGDRYEVKKNVQITQVKFKDMRKNLKFKDTAKNYGIVSSYDEIKDVITIEEFNSRFVKNDNSEYEDTFKIYDNVMDSQDIQFYDFQNERYIFSDEEFLTRFKPVYYGDSKGYISRYEDVSSELTEQEFDKRFEPVYFQTNDIITNLESDKKLDVFFFSNSDEYLIYNHRGFLRLVNMLTLETCQILDLTGKKISVFSVISGNWNSTSTIFRGVTRDNKKLIILSKISNTTFQISNEESENDQTSIAPISSKLTVVDDKTKDFYSYSSNIKQMCESFDGFFWLFEILISYRKTKDTLKLYFFLVNGKKCYFEFKLVYDEGEDYNIMEGLEIINLVDVYEFLAFNFSFNSSDGKLYLYNRDIFSEGLDFEVNFSLPFIKTSLGNIYFQGTEKIICAHSYIRTNKEIKTSSKIYESNSLIENETYGFVSPIYYGGKFYFCNDKLNLVDLKTNADFYGSYKALKTVENVENIGYTLFNIISKVGYTDVKTPQKGIDNYPISKLLCRNRFSEFQISEISETFYNGHENIKIGNLIILKDTLNKRLMRIFPRQIQTNTSKTDIVDVTAIEAFKNSKRDEFELKSFRLTKLLNSLMEKFPSLFHFNEPHLLKFFPKNFEKDDYASFLSYLESNIKPTPDKKYLLSLNPKDMRVSILRNEKMFLHVSKILKRVSPFKVILDFLLNLDDEKKEESRILESNLQKLKIEQESLKTEVDGEGFVVSKKSKKSKTVETKKELEVKPGLDNEILERINEIIVLQQNIEERYIEKKNKFLSDISILMPDISLPEDELVNLFKLFKNEIKRMNTEISNFNSIELPKETKKLKELEFRRENLKADDLSRDELNNLKRQFLEEESEIKDRIKNMKKELTVSVVLSSIKTKISSDLFFEFVEFMMTICDFNTNILLSPITFRSSVIDRAIKISKDMKTLLSSESQVDKHSNLTYEELIKNARFLAVKYYSLSDEFFRIDERPAKEFSLSSPLEELYYASEHLAFEEKKSFEKTLKELLEIDNDNSSFTYNELKNKLSETLSSEERENLENIRQKLKKDIKKLSNLRYESLTNPSKLSTEIEIQKLKDMIFGEKQSLIKLVENFVDYETIQPLSIEKPRKSFSLNGLETLTEKETENYNNHIKTSANNKLILKEYGLKPFKTNSDIIDSNFQGDVGSVKNMDLNKKLLSVKSYGIRNQTLKTAQNKLTAFVNEFFLLNLESDDILACLKNIKIGINLGEKRETYRSLFEKTLRPLLDPLNEIQKSSSEYLESIHTTMKDKNIEFTEEQLKNIEKYESELNFSHVLLQIFEILNPESKNSILGNISRIETLNSQLKTKIKISAICRDLQAENGSFKDYVEDILLRENDSYKTKIDKLKIICTERYENTSNMMEFSGHSFNAFNLVMKNSKDAKNSLMTSDELSEKVNKPRKEPKGSKSKYKKSDYEESNVKSSNTSEKSLFKIGEFWTSELVEGDENKYRIHRDRYRVLKSIEFFKSFMENVKDKCKSSRMINLIKSELFEELKKLCLKDVNLEDTNVLSVYENLIKEEVYYGLYLVLEHAISNRIIVGGSSDYETCFNNIYDFLLEIINETYCDPLITNCFEDFPGFSKREISNLMKDEQKIIDMTIKDLKREQIKRDKEFSSKSKKFFNEESDDENMGSSELFDLNAIIELLENQSLINDDNKYLMEYLEFLNLNESYSRLMKVKRELLGEDEMYTLNLTDNKVYDCGNLIWYCISGNNKLPKDCFTIFYEDYHVQSIKKQLDKIIMYLINGQYMLSNAEILPKTLEKKLKSMLTDINIQYGNIADINQICIEFDKEFHFDQSQSHVESELSSFEIKFAQSTVNFNSKATINLQDVLLNCEKDFAKSYRRYVYNKKPKTVEYFEDIIPNIRRTIDEYSSLYDFLLQGMDLRTAMKNFGRIVPDSIVKNCEDIIKIINDYNSKDFKESEIYKLLSKTINGRSVKDQFLSYSDNDQFNNLPILFDERTVENTTIKTSEYNALDFGDDIISTYSQVTKDKEMEPELEIEIPTYFDYEGVRFINKPLKLKTPLVLNDEKFGITVGMFISKEQLEETKFGKKVTKKFEVQRTVISTQKNGNYNVYRSKFPCIYPPYRLKDNILYGYKEYIEEKQYENRDFEQIDEKEIGYSLENLSSNFELIKSDEQKISYIGDRKCLVFTKGKESYQIVYYSFYEEHSEDAKGTIITMYNMESKKQIFKWTIKEFEVYDVNVSFDKLIPTVNLLGLWYMKARKMIRYGSINLTEDMKKNLRINAFDKELNVGEFVTSVKILKLSRTKRDMITCSGILSKTINEKRVDESINFVMICGIEPTKIFFDQEIVESSASKLGKFFSVTYGTVSVESRVFNIKGYEIKRVSGYASWI